MTANPNAGMLDKVVMNDTITATYTPLGLMPKDTYDLIVSTNASLCSLAHCEHLTKKQRKAIWKACVQLSAIADTDDADDDPFA